jgi:ABC transporter substrate binding protein (PQQ-dependent alcohol dehydrogenase system)
MRRPFGMSAILRAGWLLPAIFLLLLGTAPVLGQDLGTSQRLSVAIHYVEKRAEAPPTLYGLNRPPEDEGVLGARLGIRDSQAIGRLLGHNYELRETIVSADTDIRAAARAAFADQPIAVVVNVPADDLIVIADLVESRDTILINAGAQDDSLRAEQCRKNVLHTMPSRAMLTDALIQFAARKRWVKILLLVGPSPGDALLADALRTSIRKFGAKIVAEKTFDTRGADLRRTASSEMPLVAQGPDHDLVIVIDESRDFAPYVPYNTWLPRPVAGSAGLEPVAWHAAIEQWGALQLQRRFAGLAERAMTSRDWSAWAAVRAISEAVSRTGSRDSAVVSSFLLSDRFELAGFKGRPLSFRPWDGQMRQPIHLMHPGAVVGVAPFEGFLHRRNELDTLGPDEPETRCGARS